MNGILLLWSSAVVWLIGLRFGRFSKQVVTRGGLRLLPVIGLRKSNTVVRHLPACFTTFLVTCPDHGFEEPVFSLSFTCQRRMVGGIHSINSIVEVHHRFVVVQKLLEP